MSDDHRPASLAVIGGGAAGFFAAVNTARLNSDLNITIYERSREVLSKVRISGGGRCNVTHHCYDPELLSKAYPRGERELRWAFERFDAEDTVRWFEECGVPLKTEQDGRMFPTTDDSATIINCLLEEANKRGVRIRTKTKVERIEPRGDGRFNLHLYRTSPEAADSVLVATEATTGNQPMIGLRSWGIQLNHRYLPCLRSILGIRFLAIWPGIAVPGAKVEIKNSSYSQTGPVLITHWGLSGPAVLKIS
ncbi:MAG: aminoacetone oxidase family FAD-binding enzyme [Balneolaceae bacterium]|nr:aminoacetone oxidase family FAD-binding enzyme [Balneolaceae bacterium]